MKMRKEMWKIVSENKAALLINLFISCILAFSGPFSLYAQAYFIDKVESMVGTEFIILNLAQPAILLFLSFLLPMLKYSLQGTTQGRYLTGGVPPVRFSM